MADRLRGIGAAMAPTKQAAGWQWPLTGVGRGGSLLASRNLTSIFPGARFA